MHVLIYSEDPKKKVHKTKEGGRRGTPRDVVSVSTLYCVLLCIVHLLFRVLQLIKCYFQIRLL